MRITLPSSPHSLTFSPLNWEDPQTVTVSGVNESGDNADDTEDETGITVMMTATATTTGDEAFNGLTTGVNITVEDDDKDGIKVSAAGVTVAEGGAATWTVELNTDPGAGNAVEVTITSSNPDSATATPAVITFTTTAGTGTFERWDDPQTVTVSGEEDSDFLPNLVDFEHEVTSGTYDVPSRTVRVTTTDLESPSLMLGNVVPADTDVDGSTATLAIDEGTTRHKYTVALSHRPTGTVQVMLPNPDPAKLAISTNRLVFKRDRGDWDRARNIYVDALADEDDENDTFTITHSASGGGFDEQEVVLTLTVEDSGKAGLKLSATNLTLDEGTKGSFGVSLKTPPSADVVVAVGTPGDGVISVDAGPLTFTSEDWAEPQTVEVTAVDDDTADDESEAVSLTVTSSDTDYTHRDSTDQNPNVINRDVNVNVTDTDVIAMILLNQDLTPFPPSVDEGGTRVVEVYLTSEPSGQVTVAVTTDPADVADYATVSPASLRFNGGAGWDEPQTITITGVEEDSDQEDNFFGILLDASDGGYDDVDGDFAVRIVDNDIVGIKLSTDAVTVLEGTSVVSGESGAADAEWTVQLNTDPGANNAVEVSISSSNSASATVNPEKITFTTGGGNGTFQWDQAQDVTVTGETDDDIIDNLVIFKHEVSGGSYAAADAIVTVTATDTAVPALMLGNVEPADPDVDGSTDTLAIDEGTTRYQYKVALSHRPTGSVEVLMPNPDPDKFTLSTDRLVFKKDRGDWDRARNIYVDALPDDNTVNDTYIITHTASGGGYDGLAVVLALTVEDSGKAGLKLSATNLTLDEGAQGSFGVSLKTPPSADVTVTVGTPGNGVISVDEPASPNTLIFNAENWNTPKTVKVTGVDDATIDDESETVTLSVASPGDTNYQQTNENDINRTVTVNVNDTDKAGFSLSRSSTTLSEDAGNPQDVFTIVLDAEPEGSVSFAITSSDPTRVANPTGPTFQDNNWSTAQGVDLNLDDDADSDDNTVTLMMTTTADDAADAPFNGLTASFTVNISDGDRAGIRLSTDAVTVAEGGATGTWTVQLNTDPGANNAVKVSISSSNAASATASPAEITFTTDGSATGTFQWDQAQDVTVSGETDDDISDNVVIFTHRVTSGTYAAPDAIVTVTATDTAVPALMLGNVEPADPDVDGSTDTLAIDEGTTRYQYKVALSHRPTGSVEVLMPNPDPDKFTLSTDRLVFKKDRGDWDRARNIYVDALPDDNTVNDTYIITHTASGGGYDGLAVVLALTVEDSGKAGLKLSATNLTLDEGAQGSFGVSLKTPPSADVTVTVGTPVTA